MNGRARSSLFLMEILIVIAIFAVCASVCVKIFAGSYLMAKDTRDMNRALAAAKNGAECLKAYGDLRKTAYALNGEEYNRDGSREAVVYYDAGWRACGAAEAEYTLRIRAGEESAALPLLCDLSVEYMTGEEIIGFTVSAGRALR